MAEKIRGITIELGGDASGLEQALKGVNKEVKNTQAQLKDVERLLKLDPKNTELLAQKQKLLGDQIKNTNEKLKKLKEAQATMDKNGVDKNSDQYMALQREIISTENELENLKKATDKAASAFDKLAEVGNKMQEVGDKISKTGETLTKTVTAPLVGVGVLAAKSFAEVDKTMILANKTMGNTEEQAKKLQKAMEDAAAQSTFGMSDAAQAALNFARAGLNAEEAANALAPAMNLAAGEAGDLNTVSAGLVATINGFHGSFEDASHYADVFASACNNSALDINGISEAMSVAAPVFAAAGYSVEDAALYLGVMANNGIDASKAANSLKTGLARLVKPAKQGYEALSNLGLITEDGESAFVNLDGSMKDSKEVLKLLHEAFADLSESEQIAAASAIFGKNQMAPWLALINTGTEDVNALSNSIHNSAGITQEMADTMMSGFGGSLERVKSSLDVLMTSFGQAMSGYILPFIEKIQGLIDKFNGLDEGQKKTIIKILGLVAAIGPLLLVIGKLTSGIGTILTKLPMIINFIKTIWGLIAANPIALVIGAIVGLVALIATKGDEIQAYLQQFDDWLQNIFAKDWTEVFGPVLGGVINGFFDIIKSMWDNTKLVLDGIIDFIRGIFTGDWERVWTGVKEIFGGIANSLLNVFKAPLNGIISLINKAIDKFNGMIAKINKIPGINVGTIGKIPMLANGGVLAQGSAIVGEAGPELLSMDKGKAVVQPLTNGSSAAAPIYLTVQSVLDGRVIAESTTQYQERMARAHG